MWVVCVCVREREREGERAHANKKVWDSFGSASGQVFYFKICRSTVRCVCVREREMLCVHVRVHIIFQLSHFVYDAMTEQAAKNIVKPTYASYAVCFNVMLIFFCFIPLFALYLFDSLFFQLNKRLKVEYVSYKNSVHTVSKGYTVFICTKRCAHDETFQGKGDIFWQM